MPPLWRPEVSSSVVVMHGSLNEVGKRLRGSTLTIVREAGIGVHVLALSDGVRLQLLVKPVRCRGTLLVAVPSEAAAIKRVGSHIVGFADFVAGKPAGPHHAGKRLSFVLQALDGALAGANQREIALALFGAARVDRDWRHGGDHLRDAVRRAIGRGRDLMNGGYLGLLR